LGGVGVFFVFVFFFKIKKKIQHLFTPQKK
jgi:hypothetical protein